MSNEKYTCYFEIRLNNPFGIVPLIKGAMGFGGAFTKEQLRNDDKILQKALDNIYETIISTTKTPTDMDGIEVIMFLPDLID